MTARRASDSKLHYWILLGLILGAVLGTALNAIVGPVDGVSQGPPWLQALLKFVVDPIGQVFRRLLIMTVVPLVFASLAVGVAQLGSLGNLGRIGAKTLTYFVLTTALAVVIGLTLVNAVRPGEGLPAETREQLTAKYQGAAKARDTRPAFGVETFVKIVPENPVRAAADMDMLGIICVALLVGIGLTAIPPERAGPVRVFLEGIGDLSVFIIHLAMRFAPIGVFALIFSVTASFGFQLLVQLGMYVAVVLIGLAVQMAIVYPLLIRLLGGISPWLFFRKVRNVIVTAFSTSSSNATLPTSIQTAEEELGVPSQVAGFVLPLGATLNMNGTALFEGVTVVFLAQVFGVPLTLADQAIVVVMSVVTAIGAAGVPGGAIPLMAMVLATVGVEPGAIALILGVDRILDMCRTTLNVTGDLTAAVFITRSEGLPLTPRSEVAAAYSEPLPDGPAGKKAPATGEEAP
jgi:DAACS family dicarboxylate/amino acid:cation (Na+ or H+) symporter